MTRDLTKTDRTCPECSHTFGAVANHCICPSCRHRFFAVDPTLLSTPDEESNTLSTLTPQYSAALDSFDARLRNAIGTKTLARFSAFPVDDGGVPMDNLDEIAIQGLAVIAGDTDEFWGDRQSKPYQSELLENPTWLDLCIVLHDQIEVTCDRQHVFLEGVSKTNHTVIVNGRTVPIYELDLGS